MSPFLITFCVLFFIAYAALFFALIRALIHVRRDAAEVTRMLERWKKEFGP